MMFFRAFGDTKALQKEEVQNAINKYLDASDPGFGAMSVMRQFARYRRNLTPWLLFVAISDMILKFIQHIIVLVLYITYWDELSVELRIIFGFTFVIFIIVQLYSPYIYTMLWWKLRKENNLAFIENDEELVERFVKTSTTTEGVEYHKLVNVDVHDEE
jgi:hypothetical protein